MRHRRLLASSVPSALLVLSLVALPGLRGTRPVAGGDGCPATGGGVIGSGDPRGEGEGPGLVNSPVLIAPGGLGRRYFPPMEGAEGST